MIVLSLQPYKNNKRHGIARIWNENEKLMHETTWQNEKWHGVSKGWDEDGKLYYKKYYLYNVLVSKEEWRKNQLIERLAKINA